MPRPKKDQEISMLRAEIEMLMGERQSLLKIAGTAAMFISKLDSSVLPQSTYEAADVLSKCLNRMPEETLRDALELAKSEMDKPAEGG